MNVVDSSGWLEYFADEVNAGFFAPAVEDVDELVVPSISILEVFKRVLQQRGEGDALKAVAQIQLGKVAELDTALALSAGRLGINLKLPLADSVVLATARAYKALLWTQDEDFKGIKGVKYVSKRKAAVLD